MDEQRYSSKSIKFQKFWFSGFSLEDINKLALVVDVSDS